jgi:hypothetical protein
MARRVYSSFDKEHAVRLYPLLVLSALLPACGNEYHPEYHPESAYSYSQNVSQPVTVFAARNRPAAPFTGAPAPAPASDDGPSRIVILETARLDRDAKVVGAIDAPEETGNHQAALWALKTKAAALGADAIVAVELHQGDGEGKPTHVTGLAVKFVPP